MRRGGPGSGRPRLPVEQKRPTVPRSRGRPGPPCSARAGQQRRHRVPPLLVMPAALRSHVPGAGAEAPRAESGTGDRRAGRRPAAKNVYSNTEGSKCRLGGDGGSRSSGESAKTCRPGPGGTNAMALRWGEPRRPWRPWSRTCTARTRGRSSVAGERAGGRKYGPVPSPRSRRRSARVAGGTSSGPAAHGQQAVQGTASRTCRPQRGRGRQRVSGTYRRSPVLRTAVTRARTRTPAGTCRTTGRRAGAAHGRPGRMEGMWGHPVWRPAPTRRT